MTTFAERFHLTHPSKAFEILPWEPEDAKAYFGDRQLNKDLENRIERGYTMGKPPKIYLLGRWGSGKTHHLYHLQYVLQTTGVGSITTFIAPYIQIECKDDTSYSYLHRKMMDTLGLKTVKSAISTFLMGLGPDRAAGQKAIFGSDNLIIATQVLSIGDEQLAWKWLCGETLSGSELKSLNVTSNLQDTSELVDVLVRIGRLLADQGQKLIYFIDEGESLKNITKPNAQRSWHDGIKNLADNSNSSVGFIMAMFVDNANPTPEFITEDDIFRRLGTHNIVDLEPFTESAEIVPFVRDLLEARIDFGSISEFPAGSTAASFPFTDDGFELFVQELASGAASATPSKVIEGVSECAWKAHTLEEEAISMTTVQDVMPIVMAAT